MKGWLTRALLMILLLGLIGDLSLTLTASGYSSPAAWSWAYTGSISEDPTFINLSYGPFSLSILKEAGWIHSFRYKGYNIFPTTMFSPTTGTTCHTIQWRNWDTAGPYFYQNLLGMNHVWKSANDNYARITIDYLADPVGNITGTQTYTLYEDKFVLDFRVWHNSTTQNANFTFYNAFGLDLDDWENLVSYGGDHAFNTMSQVQAPLLGAFNNPNWCYGWEQNVSFTSRPMLIPAIVYLRPEMAMMVSESHFWNCSMFQQWNEIGGNLGNLNIGIGTETPLNNFTIAREFSFRFKDNPKQSSFSSLFSDYMNEQKAKLNITTINRFNERMRYSNSLDVWPDQLENATVWAGAEATNAKVVWLYGWQTVNEEYPINGSWACMGGGITINATYLKDKVAELRSNGYLVYMYFRDFFDYNNTDPAYYGWLRKIGPGPNEYYWAWGLAGGHIAVHSAQLNQSCQNHWFSLMQNVSNFYEPDGLALDLGSIGASVIDAIEWGYGWHYQGVFNLTKRLFDAEISLWSNVGSTSLAWFCDGTYFEDPGYNLWNQLELLTTHYYKSVGWILTTAHTLSDETPEKEMEYANFGLASGIGRSFDATESNAGGWLNSTCQAYILAKYNTYWNMLRIGYSPNFTYPYPMGAGSGLAMGPNPNVFCAYLEDLIGDTWLISWNNGTTGNHTYQIFSDLSYRISSIYTNQTAFFIDNQYEISYNLTGLALHDFLIEPYSTRPVLPILAIIGLIGLACFIVGPTYGLYQIKEGHLVAGIRSIVIFGVLGFGMFLGWLGVF